VAGVARWSRERWGRWSLYSMTKASRRDWRSSIAVGCSGCPRSHFFMVCWKRSTFPQVVGCPGVEFFWVIPSRRSSVSNPLRVPAPSLPWERRVVKTIPLSVNVEAGIPCSARASLQQGLP